MLNIFLMHRFLHYPSHRIVKTSQSCEGPLNRPIPSILLRENCESRTGGVAVLPSSERFLYVDYFFLFRDLTGISYAESSFSQSLFATLVFFVCVYSLSNSLPICMFLVFPFYSLAQISTLIYCQLSLSRSYPSCKMVNHQTRDLLIQLTRQIKELVSDIHVKRTPVALI